jgi:hypothetical protein
MELSLTNEEARLLDEQLTLRIEHLEAEAACTEKHELQHALALDIDRLQQIERKLHEGLAKGEAGH